MKEELPFSSGKDLRFELTEKYIKGITNWLLGGDGELRARALESDWGVAYTLLFFMEAKPVLQKITGYENTIKLIDDEILNSVKWLLSHKDVDGNLYCWDYVTWDTAVVSRSLMMFKKTFKEDAKNIPELDSYILQSLEWLCNKVQIWNYERYPLGAADLAQILRTFIYANKYFPPSREVFGKFKKYLFSWDEIPGSDNERFVEYLKQDFGIDWVSGAKIEKIDDSRTITVSNEKNCISLRLNNEKTKIKVKIDGVRKDEFNVKMENGRLNIYKKTSGEQDITLYLVDKLIRNKEEFVFDPKDKGFFWTDHFTSAEVVYALVDFYESREDFQETKCIYIVDNIRHALRFFENSQKDGRWGMPDITAMVLGAYLKPFYLGMMGREEPENHIILKALRFLCDYKTRFDDGSILHTLSYSLFFTQGLLGAYNWNLANKEILDLYDTVLWNTPIRTSVERAEKIKLEREIFDLKQKNKKSNMQVETLNKLRHLSIIIFFIFIIYSICKYFRLISFETTTIPNLLTLKFESWEGISVVAGFMTAVYYEYNEYTKKNTKNESDKKYEKLT